MKKTFSGFSTAAESTLCLQCKENVWFSVFESKRSQQAWMSSESDFLPLWSLRTLLTRSAAKFNWIAEPHWLPTLLQPSLPWWHVLFSSSSLSKCVKKRDVSAENVPFLKFEWFSSFSSHIPFILLLKGGYSDFIIWILRHSDENKGGEFKA